MARQRNSFWSVPLLSTRIYIGLDAQIGIATLEYCRWEKTCNRLLIPPIALLLVVLGSNLASSQSTGEGRNHSKAPRLEDFSAAIKNLRETWVREFNAGHADKVAALYEQEAVLMRKSGSVHKRDSIQAELERSITTVRWHNYTVESLHAEHNGDLGYDTGDL